MFLSTLDYKFLLSYLQLWQSYAILSATTQFTAYAQNVHHRPKCTLGDMFYFTSLQRLRAEGGNANHQGTTSEWGREGSLSRHSGSLCSGGWVSRLMREDAVTAKNKQITLSLVTSGCCCPMLITCCSCNSQIMNIQTYKFTNFY